MSALLLNGASDATWQTSKYKSKEKQVGRIVSIKTFRRNENEKKTSCLSFPGKRKRWTESFITQDIDCLREDKKSL